MVTREVTVVNVLGLHARAAARFVRIAGQFTSAITVTRAAHTMDGKSILGLLFLSAARGSVLTIAANGPDEDAAVAALLSLVERGFEE
jgi:phosphocarrier protein HPr